MRSYRETSSKAQRSRLADLLALGPVTTSLAQDLGIDGLGNRIWELRHIDGLAIDTTRVWHHDEAGELVGETQYQLAGGEHG